MTQSMLEARGADYVTNWPRNIATRTDIPEHFVLWAVKAVTGHVVERDGTGLADNDRVRKVVGALDGPTAKRIIVHAREAYARHQRETRDNCHYCGLPTSGGECRECV